MPPPSHGGAGPSIPPFASMPHFAGYTPPPEEPTPRERLDRLKTIGRRALQHWKPALAIVAVGCAASVGLALQQKLIFRSECVVLYRLGKGESEESGVDRVMHLAPRLRQVLTTRARLESVVRDFELYPRIVEGRGMGEAVDEARDHIEVRGRDSETFFLSFESDSRETAQQVTQRLADDMIKEFESQKVAQAKQRASFVAREQEQAEARMDEAEKALSTFAGEHPVMAASVRGSMPGSADLLVTAQRGAMAPGSAAPAIMAATGGGTATPAEQALPTSVAGVLAQLTASRDEAAARVARAQQELQEKLAGYTDQHPDVVAARGDLAVAQRALDTANGRLERARAEAQVASGSASTPPAKAKPHVGARVASAAPAAPMVQESPVNEAELRLEFERRLRAVRDARELYAQRRETLEKANLELSAAQAAANESMAILDPANLPTKPFKGGRSKIALGGGFLSLILAVAYAVAAVLFDDRVRDVSDLRQLGLRAPLGVIPRISVPPRGRRG
jgi:uncharacterized protein involved in exopolysaccharide biosynthesis